MSRRTGTGSGGTLLHDGGSGNPRGKAHGQVSNASRLLLVVLSREMSYIFIGAYVSLALLIVALVLHGPREPMVAWPLLIWGIINMGIVSMGSFRKSRTLLSLGALSFLALISVTIPLCGSMNYPEILILVVLLVSPILFFLHLALQERDLSISPGPHVSPAGRWKWRLMAGGASVIAVLGTLGIYLIFSRTPILSGYMDSDVSPDLRVLLLTASLILACTPFLLMEPPSSR